MKDSETKSYLDYPREPIGGRNPYYCCQSCQISDPEINGRLDGHADWCEWRKGVETLENMKEEKTDAYWQGVIDGHEECSLYAAAKHHLARKQK